MSFKIVIVGTGIAGLSAALALSIKGHSVTVVEATTQLQPIGGIIVMQANANRVLDKLGLYDSLARIGVVTSMGPSTRRYKDGDYLIKKPKELHEKSFGYPLWPLHRADLQRQMYDAAVSRGVIIRLGCSVVGLDESNHTPAVIIKGGERIEADLIVGADGIKSTIRKSMIPDSKCVRDSGMDITRLNIPESTVRSDPETSTFMEQIGLWCGPSTTLAVMPVRRGNEWFLGLDCCHVRDETSKESTSQKQDVERLKKYFQDFAPPVQKLLSFAKEAYVWRLIETKPSNWTGQSGRVVLIGDAAHAALPWVGQGGGMALEDAVTLAECLDRVQLHSIPEALRAFQIIREPRCRLVQDWAASKGKQATVPDGPEQEQRDMNLKHFNSWVRAKPSGKAKNFQSSQDNASQFESPDWMSAHDAVELANRELDRIFGVRY